MWMKTNSCSLPKMVLKQFVVVLGSGNVGKTSILHKYLNDTFADKYTQTVEDVYSQDVCVKGEVFMIDYLDTSGSIAFPAMRRLEIQKATAFLLVFSIDNEDSFDEMKRTWQEIKTSRSDHKDIPCIVIANKMDKENFRKVEYFEALNWADNNGLGGMMIEASPKTGENLENVFEKLFTEISFKAHQQTALRTQSHKKVRMDMLGTKKGRFKPFTTLISCGRKEED
ncbi:dexamethasone-induced Ras-related protein 1-like [Ylistrum balloti]|uniref:dexamethasone-induced Ras-related protein 1-like n=1 Tax=Ylistrum balloti TaxID=509963 RepID=UPI002905D509|nr:dexamethasone-induced Ras-related protein 1-like [Ylistrum balloti]